MPLFINISDLVGYYHPVSYFVSINMGAYVVFL